MTKPETPETRDRLAMVREQSFDWDRIHAETLASVRAANKRFGIVSTSDRSAP